MKEFKDKVLVVTGAGDGIGRAIALEGARRGMKIAANDIDRISVEETVKRIRDAGGEAVAHPEDITLYQNVEDLLQLTLDTYGQVDMLCNNAGCAVSGPIWEIPLNDIHWITELNLLSHLYGMKVFIPQMIKQGTPAAVINTESTAGLMTSGNAVMYHATKFGGVAASEGTYLALKTRGINNIQLHCLVPAYVQTGIYHSDDHRPERYAINDDPYYASQEYKAGLIRSEREVKKSLPIKHVGEVVFTAVEDERFYIFTHPESQVIAQPRVQRLASGRNPE